MSFPGMQGITVPVAAPKLDPYSIQYVSGKVETVWAHEVQWGSAFTRFYSHPNPTTRILELAVNNELVDFITELTPEEVQPKAVA